MSQIDDRDHVARLEGGKIVCSRIVAPILDVVQRSSIFAMICSAHWIASAAAKIVAEPAALSEHRIWTWQFTSLLFQLMLLALAVEDPRLSMIARANASSPGDNG